MLVLCLIAGFGLVAIALLCSLFAARGSTQRAAAVGEVEREVVAKIHKAQDAEASLVGLVVDGASVDQAVAEYQRSRAAILTGASAEKPWDWSAVDLDSWKVRELKRRTDDVNRQLRVPAVSSTLFTMLFTATALVVYYQFIVAVPIHMTSGQIGRPPALSTTTIPAANDPSGEANVGSQSNLPSTPTESRP